VVALLTAHYTRRRQRFIAWPKGFTLLEILVVIVIVGVIISVVTVSVGVLGRDRDMQEQAERIWAVLNQAREESELQGFDVGLRVGTNSYDFLRFDARQQLWLPVVEDDLLSARALPPGLRLRLILEGREVVLKERLEGEASATSTEKKADAPSDAKDKENAEPDKKDPDKKDKKKELPPQILILSSGDLNAFDLQFEREGGDAHWHVFSRPDSTLVAEQVHDEL